MDKNERHRIYFGIYKGAQIIEDYFCSGCQTKNGNVWEIPWSVRSVATRGLGVATIRWETNEDGSLNMTGAHCNRFNKEANSCGVGGGACRVNLRLKHETWFRKDVGAVRKLKLRKIFGGITNW
jgi:hypothetical protein